MNLFRWIGWLWLFIGAGAFTGDVYHLLIFVFGFGLIAFNPVIPYRFITERKNKVE